jgi:nuclear transcription factor Y gamma
MCDFLIDIVPREEAAKASNPIYDQNAAYVTNNVVNNAAAAAAAAYYPPQYAPAQIDPNYYSQIPQVSVSV